MSKHAKLINEVRETLAKEFSGRLAENAQDVATALTEVANETVDTDMKRAILDARDVWESRLLEWEPAIQADFIKRFDEKISGDDDKMSKTMTFSADSLTLVGDEEVRADILLGNVAKHLKDKCDYELFALTKRLESLLEVTELDEKRNPVWPRNFCRAFLAGMTVVEANLSQRCEILSAGWPMIGAALNDAMKEANEVLVSRGFMIEIPVSYGKIVNRSVSRAPLSLTPSGGGGGGGSSGSGAGGGSNGGGGGATSSGAATTAAAGDVGGGLHDLFSKLFARLPGMNAGAGASHSPLGAAPSAGAPAPVSADQLMAQLLTSRPLAADAPSATAARAAIQSGASPEATAAAASGVQVTLNPALLEALERFAASPPTMGAVAPAPVPTAPPASGHSMGASPADPASINAIGTESQFASTERLPSVAAATPSITNLVRQAQPMLASIMEPVQAVITDVAAGVFDRIFAAPDIPDSIKALIGKLQLKIFKALMQDPQIFTNPDHPLRQFIDELADIGVKRQQSLAQGDPVFERISTIVNNLYQHFDEDPKAIERARHQLSVFIAAEEESAQGVIFDSVVEVQQQEEIEMGASMAAFEVDRRLAGRMMLRTIKEFARQHWQRLLAKDYLVDGEDGAQWKADLVTLDELLWSISAADASRDRARLLKLVPTLLGRLNAGLDRIDVSHETREPYFQVLVAIHTGLLRLAKGAALMEDAGDVDHELGVPVSDPRAKLRRRNTAIERGQWIEMKNDDGSSQRCRLSWVSPLKETFVFKNYDTKEAITLSAEEFVWLESQGRVKLIEEHSLTERSIEGAIRGLLAEPSATDAARA